MNLVLMLLLDYIDNPHTSVVDNRIAKYIIHHFQTISKISIQQLADLLGVSISQISRFVRHIGFSSFQELKESIEYHGNAQRHSSIQKEKGLDIVCYQKMIQEEVDYFFENFQFISLDNLMSDLMQFDKIALFGILNSNNAARELQYNLAFNNVLCVSLTEFQSQISYINNADKETLILIYSMSGEYVLDNAYSRYYHLIPCLKKCQAKIYVITNNTAVKSLSYIDEIIFIPNIHKLYQYSLQCFNDTLILQYQKKIHFLKMEI